MEPIITKPALRIKVTGICNRSCSFCNEEGDMRNIEEVSADTEFFNCIDTLTDELGLKRVMLTGGEPTVHPHLEEIVRGINTPEISVTTNAIRPLSALQWGALKMAGLTKVIASIHDASPQSFIQLETRRRDFGWAVRSLESQKYNLASASEAGLAVRVNIVAYNSADHVQSVLNSLQELQLKHQFEIRILNDLANIEHSQQVIRDVCLSLGASEIEKKRRAGSSNATAVWKTESGFAFSTKMSYRYFFNPICSTCNYKAQCHEGFYGIRIERRLSNYWVRLCIYKGTRDVLMPWKEFLASDLATEFRKMCVEDQ